MTKVECEVVEEEEKKEKQPLRFCDLEPGDVFRWERHWGHPEGRYLCVVCWDKKSYRYLTRATETATAMEMETETAMVMAMETATTATATEMVERYPSIKITLPLPERFR